MLRKAIVVGGGPAGAATAIGLRRMGFPEVEVLEHERRGRDKVCAGGISPRAIGELRKLELFEPARRDATAIRGAYVRRPGAERPLRFGDKPALVMRRSDLDALLLEHAERLGARVTAEIEVDRLLEEAGEVRGVAAGELELEADVVVVATGARNELCWDPRPRRRVDAILWRFADAPHEPDMMRFYYERAIAPFYVWLFPEPEGTVNVGCCRSPRPGQRSMQTLLEELVRECFPQLDGATPVGAPRSHAIVSTPRARHLAKPGALRVGEAAWLTDSFTGEGIWHALASGALAARAIGLGDLDGYAVAARKLFDPALAAGDWLARLATTRAWSWALGASELRPVAHVASGLMRELGRRTAR